MAIEFNTKYEKSYKELLNEGELKDIPIEFYQVSWTNFKDEHISTLNKFCNVSQIDTSINSYNSLVDSYINEEILSVLDDDEQKNLGIAYRINKSSFSNRPELATINKAIAEKSFLTNRHISLSLAQSNYNSWKKELSFLIDNIPFSLSGKGTQNIVKTNLALNKVKEKSNIILIEEPENHLSFSNMSILIDNIENYKENKQIFIVTHSNFVANKLGLQHLILVNDSNFFKFNELSFDTEKYFKKLPGFDTLRLILSKTPILCEGPSDELLIQKAYLSKYKKLPILDGVDIISVRGLSFKRFCEIANKLNKKIKIITDNDGDIENRISKKYSEYNNSEYINIFYDKDENNNTLEPSFVNTNKKNIKLLSEVLFGKELSKDELILKMQNNKSEWALKIFESEKEFEYPEHINECIKK